MMIYDFVPPKISPYQFGPTLDGQVYTGIVKWNTFGQRNYLDLFAQDGTRIFTLPLIGSVTGLALQSLSWANGLVTATSTLPHGYRVTDTIEATISGCVPDAFNGVVDVLITGPSTFTWPLAANPGNATDLGIADYNVDIVAGYFATSTMVYREASQQIIVTP